MHFLQLFTRLSGILAACICTIAYFILASINSTYDHFTKAFSVLGSVGQPNNLWASLWGFLIPGLLIILFFLRLPAIINHGKVKKYPFVLIAFSGLLMAIGASPMNYQNFSSISSILHIVGVMGGGFAFMLGAFTISKQIKKDEYWKKLVKPLLVLTWIFIIIGFFRDSALPGLAQKLGILTYYLYISLLSWNAFRLMKASTYANKHV